MVSSTPEDFWGSVGPPNSTGCKEWQGFCNGSGYGVKFYQGKRTLTHRLAWTLTFGLIPDGILVCHTCDNRRCCEPTHLFLGSQADNYRDMVDKGRRRAVQGSGHPRSKLNDELVRQIRARYGVLKSLKGTAKEFNVSFSTISSIINGRTWSHVK